MRLIQGDNGLSVETLKRKDIAIIAEAAWKSQRRTLLETLDEAQLDPAERFTALKDHNLTRGSTVPVSIHLLSIEGCLEIIEAACSKSKVDLAKFVGDLTIPALARIAREIVWMIRDEEEMKAEGETQAAPIGP